MDKIYQADWYGHLPEAYEEALVQLLDRVINVSARSTSTNIWRPIRGQYEVT
jgi:hypothetical protein